MASCTFNRLDSRDTTNATGKYPSRLIMDGDEIMVAWWDRAQSGQPAAIRFARFDTITLTPNSEVSIKDYTFANTPRAVDMIQTDAGVLVATWYAGDTVAPGNNASAWSRSTDGGATWSAAGIIHNTGHINLSPYGLCRFGETVWQLLLQTGSGGPGSTGDIYAYKSVNAGTSWDAGTQIYNGTVSGTPPAFEGAGSGQPLQAHLNAHMASATVGFMVGWRSTDAANNTRRLTCLFTTDGWATATAQDIQTFTASGGGSALQLIAVSSGRVYLLTHNPDDTATMLLYYTDDNGDTWTSIGTPTVYDTWLTTNSAQGDADYDSFLCLDEVENLIFGQSTQGAISPNGLHGTFRSVDPTDIADYVLAGECSYLTTVDNLTSTMAGRGIIHGTTLYRLVEVNRGGGTFYTLEFLAVEGAGIPEEPPPPPPVPPAIESGADDNNLMFRIDLAEGRGWSLHAFPPACFMAWPEGDEETGPEVHLTLIGNPTMDPGLQDPALLWGIRRIESDFEGYGWRVFVSDGTNIHTRNDPMRMYIRTKEFTIVERKGEGLRNVARQAFFTYTFDAPPGEVLPVQVWVDRTKQNRTIELPTTFGEEVSEWFSLPTALNVGETVQFVIDEISNYKVEFDAFGMSYIPKGRRS